MSQKNRIDYMGARDELIQEGTRLAEFANLKGVFTKFGGLNKIT